MSIGKLYLAFLFAIQSLICYSQEDLKKALPLSFRVSVVNPLNAARSNEMIFIPAAGIQQRVKDFNPKAFVVLDNNNTELASQYNSKDKLNEGIVLVLDELKAGEQRELSVRYKKEGVFERSYIKRTQAELSHKTGGAWKNREYVGGTFKNVDYLRVPPDHKDHSWFIRYEGPGWESDKVGYRLYLDQRNATDVFGKKVSEMVLQQVGQDGFDSYHEMQPWGMDVMKVGPSLGLGSIGAWSNGKITRVEKTDSADCRILENGSEYASFLTNYFGWKVADRRYTVKSQISIHAGTRLTKTLLLLDQDADSLCTGIVKDKNATLLSSEGDASSFGYLATWGKQSLNNDELGLAVFFDPKSIVAFSEDTRSHVVTLKSSDKTLAYYFLGAWSQETDGINNEDDFRKYISHTAQRLAAPVKVELKK